MTNPVYENNQQFPQQPLATVPVQPEVELQISSSENKEGEVIFKKPYSFEGKEYKSVDLSSIEDLSGEDLLEADRIYSGNGQFSPVPELTLPYSFAIASKAAKLPLEFFQKMPAREALKVKNTVVRFLNN